MSRRRRSIGTSSGGSTGTYLILANVAVLAILFVAIVFGRDLISEGVSTILVAPEGEVTAETDEPELSEEESALAARQVAIDAARVSARYALRSAERTVAAATP